MTREEEEKRKNDVTWEDGDGEREKKCNGGERGKREKRHDLGGRVERKKM